MKRIILIVAVFFQLISARSQTIENIFLSMPPEILPTLNQPGRLNLIDLYKEGEKAENKDLLNNKCALTVLQDDYIRLESEKNSLELISLPMINDSRLLLVIQTVCAPTCDSRLNFYTIQWKELDTNSFLTPVDKNWFIREDVGLNFDFMKFSYSPEKKLLIQEYQTSEYLEAGQEEKEKSNLKEETKSYHWSGTRFE